VFLYILTKLNITIFEQNNFFVYRISPFPVKFETCIFEAWKSCILNIFGQHWIRLYIILYIHVIAYDMCIRKRFIS